MMSYDMTAALHVLRLQLSPPPQPFLAPIKSRMETFWYQLTQVNLEKCALLEWRDRYSVV